MHRPAGRLGAALGPGPVVLVGHSQSCQVVAAAEPKGQAPGKLAQWLHTGPRGMWALWRSAAPDSVDRRLAGVAVPVDVVRGTRDRLCPHD